MVVFPYISGLEISIVPLIQKGYDAVFPSVVAY